MLDTLLISSDPKLTATLRSACLKVGITPKLCASPAQVAAVLAHKKIYCVIMDDLDNATAIEVMKTFQQSPSSRSVVPMAIHTGSPSAIPGLMFSVVKPLAEEAAVRTLRAAHGQMVQELRRYIRYPLTVPVTLTSERGQELRAVCRNLSLRGVGIQVPARLTVGVSVQTQLALEAGVTLAGVGQVAWCDVSGRAGISCRGATQRDQRQLEQWLKARSTR